MPEDASSGDVDAWLAAVYARWYDIGLSGVERVRLRRELERDLADAVDTGAGLTDLISADPAEFADQVASANGLGTPSPGRVHVTAAKIATTAIVGAGLGAAVVWFLIWPYLMQLAPTASDGALVGLGYPLGAITVLLGTSIALRRLLGRRRFHTEVGPTLLGMVGGCLLGLPPALAISRALDYPTQPALVLIEAAPLIALAFVGVILARYFAGALGARTRTDTGPSRG